jgi:50S ribosomal subunit-associated GTPase HflX
VWLSAYTGDGLDDLLKTIKSFFLPNRKIGRLVLKENQHILKSYLYKNQLVIDETYSDNGDSIVNYDMPISTWGKLSKQYNLI